MHGLMMHPHVLLSYIAASLTSDVGLLTCISGLVSSLQLMYEYVDRRQAWAGLFMAGGLRSASYLFQKVRKAYDSH